jgi:hypothetical protein
MCHCWQRGSQSAIVSSQLWAGKDFEELPPERRGWSETTKAWIYEQSPKILGDVVEANGDIIIPKDGRMAEMTHGILLQFWKTGKQERLDLNRSKHVIEIVRTECSEFKIIEARRNRKCEVRCTIM